MLSGRLYDLLGMAARAAPFTVLTPYNVAPQYRNQPHPTLPGMYAILIYNPIPYTNPPTTTTITHPGNTQCTCTKAPPHNQTDTYT